MSEKSPQTPKGESSSQSLAAEEFLSTDGSFSEGHGTSTTLFLEMPKVPESVWSWIRQYEAVMINASCADPTIVRRTSTGKEPAVTKEARRLTSPSE